MPNNKDNPSSGSQSATGDKQDREFENQGKTKGSGGDGQGQQAGGSQKANQGNTKDEEMNTAGGRKGQFSDTDRDSESQWSPGSSQASDK